jgi:hypothetical protein
MAWEVMFLRRIQKVYVCDFVNVIFNPPIMLTRLNKLLTEISHRRKS